MKTNPSQLAIYIGAIALPAVIIVVLLLKLIPNDKNNDDAPPPNAEQVQVANAGQSVSETPPMVSNKPQAEIKEVGTAQPVTAAKPDIKEKTDSKKAVDQVKRSAAQPNPIKPAARNKPAEKNGAISATEAYIFIACKEEAQVFVDGADKGKVAPAGLTITASPSAHKIIITSKTGSLYTQNVQLDPGKKLVVKPSFCG